MSHAVSWEILGDKTAHPKTEAVIALLEKLQKKAKVIGDSEMVVTLESAPRQVIVKVRVTGSDALFRLISDLQEMGLTDRLEETYTPEKGVDAAFS